jgi:outer membrane protein OmpA-like peptidoglycan-associated protein
MKLARPATLLTVGLMALALGGAGCNKNPQKTTNIPGFGPGITDDKNSTPTGTVLPPTGGIGPGAGVSTIPINTDGSIPVGSKDLSTYRENRTEFRDQTVYFEFDKATIPPSEISKLEEVVRRMKSMPTKGIKVEGHCDERGTEEYNRTLGDRRALSIREWLAGHGMSAEMIATISFGEDKPADSGHNDAAYKKNRRGELILLSPPGSN